MENNDNNQYSAESPEIQDLSREIQSALREARLNCDILELILDRYLRNSITMQPRTVESTPNIILGENVDTTPVEGGRSSQAASVLEQIGIAENAGHEEFNYLVPRSPRQGRGFAYENGGRRRLGTKWHMYFSGFLLALLFFGILFSALFFQKGAEKKSK